MPGPVPQRETPPPLAAGTRDRGSRPARAVGALAVAAWLAAAAWSSACGKPQQTDGGRPTVVVSVPPLAHFVRRLAGDAVDIEVMVPAGASHHTHEPTMAQVARASRAAIYVKVGHPAFTLEAAWIDRVATEGNDRVRVVDLSDGLRIEEDDDPHLWVSPRIVRRIVAPLAAALTAVMPEARDEIEGRRIATLADIDALDAELRGLLGAHRGRRFYVYHPAWGYFAADYGLVQVALETHGREPDPAGLASILASARRDGVETIFVQRQFSRSSAEVAAAELGNARLVELDPFAEDWPASLRRAGRALATEFANVPGTASPSPPAARQRAAPP